MPLPRRINTARHNDRLRAVEHRMNHKNLKAWALLSVATVVVTAAAAQSAPAGGHGAHGSHGAAPAAKSATAASASTAAYETAAARMHTGMAIPYTGNSDVDFARGMIPHHQGAIDMARVQLRHGKDPAMRKLAQEVIDAQEKEISFLQEWLRRHEGRK